MFRIDLVHHFIICRSVVLFLTILTGLNPWNVVLFCCIIYGPVVLVNVVQTVLAFLVLVLVEPSPTGWFQSGFYKMLSTITLSGKGDELILLINDGNIYRNH